MWVKTKRAEAPVANKEVADRVDLGRGLGSGDCIGSTEDSERHANACAREENAGKELGQLSGSHCEREQPQGGRAE
jgi:hypothetical protein